MATHTSADIETLKASAQFTLNYKPLERFLKERIKTYGHHIDTGYTIEMVTLYTYFPLFWINETHSLVKVSF